MAPGGICSLWKKCLQGDAEFAGFLQGGSFSVQVWVDVIVRKLRLDDSIATGIELYMVHKQVFI